MNGTRVRTVHGIYGTVVDSDDRNVMLEIAPGVRIKMLRQAVGAIVPDDEPDGLNPTMQAFEEPHPDGDTQRVVIGQRRRSQRPEPLAAPLLTERKTRHSWLPQAPPTPGRGGTSQPSWCCSIVMLAGVLGGRIFDPAQWHKSFVVGRGLDLSSGTSITLQAQTDKQGPRSRARPR